MTVHPDVRADYILANPPFNVKDWGGDQLRERPALEVWGSAGPGNANFAWVQHIVHHLGTGRRRWSRAGERFHVN